MIKIYISEDSRTESYHIRPHECDLVSDSDYYKITKVFIEDNKVHSHEFGAIFEDILKRENACNCGGGYTNKVISRDITKAEFEQIKLHSKFIPVDNG